MKIYIVSNRLPFAITRDEDGSISMVPSSGGLVTSLAGAKKTIEFRWIGFLEDIYTQEEKKEIKRQMEEKKQFECIPVFIEEEMYSRYYNGYSNSCLWPVMHYFPDDIDFEDKAYVSYRDANMYMAQKLVELAECGDMFWIHDYHFMLLPKCLRKCAQEAEKKIKIGFFLHICFPPYEILCRLPRYREVIDGVLDADLIGFQVCEYTKNFKNMCKKIYKDREVRFNRVVSGNHVTLLREFPIGIDPFILRSAMETPYSRRRVEELKKKFSGRMVFLGIERADYIKGIPLKLMAFREFLKANPGMSNKVAFIQVAVPTRTVVNEFKNQQKILTEIVANGNSELEFVDNVVFYLKNGSVCTEELVSLYSVADVLVVTSIRDGMNIIGLEYLACSAGKPKIVIMSKFAGCLDTLPGAIIVNPWNQEEIISAYCKAVSISEQKEVFERFLSMESHVDLFTSMTWADSFTKTLMSIEETKTLKHD